MRALITGISGFVGSHLVRQLQSVGWDVFGFSLRTNGLNPNFFQGEITDSAALKVALDNSKPDVIFHLAGVLKSLHADIIYKTNLLGTVTLMDQVVKSKLRPIIIVASSSAVYGSIYGTKPISERMQLTPLTHYAVSKAAQEITALRYYRSLNLPVIIARMFNLLGPGQSIDFACSAFARQIAQAELLNQGEIVTGNLEARRDFVDVRDAVCALDMLVEKGKYGQIYNICSGHAVTIRKCLTEMISMSAHGLNIVENNNLFQKNDVPVQIGNSAKLQKATGWLPKIFLKQSLLDLLNDWRQREFISLQNVRE